MKMSNTASQPKLQLLVGQEMPEVPAKAQPPRKLTMEEKLKHLTAVASMSPRERGSYLRHHGIYASTLLKWQKAQAAGTLGGKVGRPSRSDHEKQLQAKESEIARLQAKLARAEKVIEVQKKLCELLDLKT